MEFTIDINANIKGKITITDQSKLYNQYLDEDLDTAISPELFKFSETATLNVLTKINISNIVLKEVLLDDHKDITDSSSFKVEEDGYYLIDHVVLPNMNWFESATNDKLNYFNTIYLTDGEKLYKIVDDSLEECSVREIIERNAEGTTLCKTKVDLIYTGNLQECYISKCQSIFDTHLNKCKGVSDNLTFERDFLWMTLNIIDYLVCRKQFMEAQRIIENFNSCNGFCKQNINNYNQCCCGCS